MMLLVLVVLLLHDTVVLARQVHVGRWWDRLKGLKGGVLMVEGVGGWWREEAGGKDSVVGGIRLEGHISTDPGLVDGSADVGGGTSGTKLDDVVAMADLGGGGEAAGLVGEGGLDGRTNEGGCHPTGGGHHTAVGR